MADNVSFQKQEELKKLSNYSKIIADRLVKYANSCNINVACKRLEKDLYNDSFPFVLAYYMYNYYVNPPRRNKHPYHHYEICISDDKNNLSPYTITFYLVPDGNKNSQGYDTFKAIGGKEFSAIVDKYDAMTGDDPISKQYQKAIVECNNFVDDIKNQIIKSKTWKEFRELVATVYNNHGKKSYKNEKLVLSWTHDTRFENYDFTSIIEEYIKPYHVTETAIFNCKSHIAKLLKAYYEMSILLNVRRKLLERLKTEGIANLVDVEVDSTVDLTSEYILNLIRANKKTYEQIIVESFKHVGTPDELEKSIIQLLKLYYEFHHINERNAMRLAKFLKANNLTKTAFEASLCEIEGIPDIFAPKNNDGTSHNPGNEREYLPETYRYKKYVVIAKSSSTHEIDPETGKRMSAKSSVEYDERLLEKMQAVAIMFNESENGTPEGTEILDIQFDPNTDNGFIFEFISHKVLQTDKYGYTKEVEPDGRRLSIFTRMFNNASPDIGTLYLSYKN